MGLFMRLATQAFYRPHYDDAVRDPLTGAKSEWTILIYLTGTEDGVEGGEVSLHSETHANQVLINGTRLDFTKTRRKKARLVTPFHLP
jgi:hypothetical protein